MPFQLPGYASFSDINRAQEATNAGSEYLSGNLAKLGQNISAAISAKNARDEAQQIAPVLNQQYQQGFQQIQSGNVGEGLGAIYQASAMASANPLLQRLTQDTNQAAGYLANDYMHQVRNQATIDARTQIAQDQIASREGIAQDRMDNQNDQGDLNRANRLQVAGVNHPPGGTPVDPQLEFQRALNNRKQFMTQRGDLVTARDQAQTDGDPQAFAAAQTQLQDLDSNALKAGLKFKGDDGNSFLSPDEYKKVTDLQAKIKDNTASLAAGKTTSWTGQSFKDNISAYDKEVNSIYDRASTALHERYGQSENTDTTGVVGAPTATGVARTPIGAVSSQATNSSSLPADVTKGQEVTLGDKKFKYLGGDKGSPSSWQVIN